MKTKFTIQATAFVSFFAIASIFSSCTQEVKAPASAEGLIESSGIVGLWQKQQEVVTDDPDAGNITYMQSTNLYKCILPDGSFFLFRASTDSLNNNIGQIEMYGTYKLSSDTLCTEVITSHCTLPELAGVVSDVHYNMPDQNMLNVWYNLKNVDGTTGSSEWVPELWTRVGTSR